MTAMLHRGEVDCKSDKHAVTSLASRLCCRCCSYIAPTTSIGTPTTLEMPTHLTVVGMAIVLDGVAAAVAAPVVVPVLKFGKH